MVNLKPESSDGFANTRRNHRNFGYRFGRDREEKKQVPNGLLQLDALAQRSVMLMEKHGSTSSNNYHVAMDLLRLQYNLNFIVLCEQCNGPHAVDEILAPER
ncbi:uncharacterized protein LOC123689384 [Pieris rapae]|uniref:uncharacterized protein LOC123689384 n=1 Tax=Pieris rapae TaxID=64459 RepID=UPI001E281AAA|nr:uncharacterized protein LOC123689384 [Pieris rapae]